ncbi:MAG: Gldg family protein [Halofilum sp. (in: g-proteobacteria)]|nr:Gldg family protein [Halofilum sp. (in: g-proteobacteria)]
MVRISRRRLQSAIGLALAAVLFVAVVLLADTLARGYRVDLTADELYTVSAETRQVLGGIDEPITLTLYFSHDAAEGVPFVRQYAQRVRELLEEYAAYADGRVRLRTVDPKPLTEARDRAAEHGLEPVPAGTTDARIYLGLVGTNSTDGLEVIEFLDPQRERFLEYDITRLVWSLSHPDKPVVGIMSRLDITESYNPSTGQPRPAWAVVDRLEQVAEVREVETPTDTIDPAIDVLMLVHPHGYDDGTLYAIDQFLTHGGRAAVFLDPVAGTASGRRGQGGNQRSRSDPGPLLGAWGVDVTLDRALADPRHGLVVSRGEEYGRTVHPGLIGITRPGMAEDDVITGAVERLVFGSAGVISEREGGLAVTPLVHSPNSAALLPAERFVGLEDPGRLAQGLRPDRELHTLVARLDGTLRSAWPDGPPEGGVPPAGGHRAAADDAHLVLFADTDLLSDRLWVQSREVGGRTVRKAWSGNGDLVANAIDNLTGSEALIRIRGEGTSARPFTRVEALEREAANRYRDKERELRQALEQTEQRLEALRSGEGEADAGGVILSDEQRAELERQRQRRARLRAELREVRQRLDAEIEALGNRLKLLNIAGMPLAVTLAALVVFALRRRRRRRAPGAR